MILKGMHSVSYPHQTCLMPQSPYNSQNNVTSWGPSVYTHDPVRDSSHMNYYSTTICLWQYHRLYIFFLFWIYFYHNFFLLRILYTIIIKYDHICSLFLSSSSLNIPPICLLPNFIPLCSPFFLFFLTMHWVQLVLTLCAWVQGHPVDHGKHTNKNTFKWFFLPQAAFNCQWLLNKGWGLESILHLCHHFGCLALM